MDMMNTENATEVANNIGKCLCIEQESEIQKRGFMRIKSEVEIGVPLLAGFWWTDSRGADKWASIKLINEGDAEMVLAVPIPRIPRADMLR